MPSIRSLSIGGLLTVLVASATAQTDDVVTNLFADRPAVAAPPRIDSHWATLPIDHFNESDTRTFGNRYWYNATYYQTGGPVFFYDNGEEGVSDLQAYEDVAVDGGPVIEMAKAFNGIAITWEHRYFGQSQPFELDSETLAFPYGANEAYQYHTVEQALEDVAYFAKTFTIEGLDSNALHPDATPWIFIGGSYPGARAAWARVRNPEIWYASWSSSGVVQTAVDGSSYFNPISRSIPQNCSNDIAAALGYIDAALGSSDPSTVYSMQQSLYTAYVRASDGQNNTIDYTQASQFSNADYAALLMKIWGSFQYTGPSAFSDQIGTLQPFCDYMERYDTAQSTSGNFLTSIYSNSDDGTVTDDGVNKHTSETQDVVDAFLFALVQISTDGLLSTPPRAKAFPVDDAAWSWLVFNEVGWFQATSDTYFDTQTYNSQPVASKYYDMAAFIANGHENSLPNVTFPDTPSYQKINDAYGGWDMNPTNVMFTSGEIDPWRAFTVASQEDKRGAPVRNATQVIPACNTAPSADTFFGNVFPGAVHCSDLYVSTESEESKTSQDLFTAALKEWLPCFQPSNGTGSRK